MRTLAHLLVIATLSGCGAQLSQVPISASPQDLASIAGTWDGTYQTTKGGTRHGYVYFTVTAEKDSAQGYVLMTVEQQTPEMNVTSRVYPAPSNRAEQVAIRFVVIDGGYIRGELENYRDPECGCQLHTVFYGQRNGDVFSGTFQTRHRDTAMIVAGTWRTTRSVRK